MPCSQQEIDRKRLAQEGVLVPVTARRSEEVLPRGFPPGGVLLALDELYRLGRGQDEVTNR